MIIVHIIIQYIHECAQVIVIETAKTFHNYMCVILYYVLDPTQSSLMQRIRSIDKELGSLGIGILMYKAHTNEGTTYEA